MSLALNVLNVLGYISTILVILSAIYIFILWLRGIVPVLVRLGNGLARRKIVIFAKGDTLNSLKDLLHDSKLFNQTNVTGISLEGDIRKCESATMFLVYWPDWHEHIDAILRCKTDGIALVVYAPPGSIPQEAMAKLGNERNVTVSNFRGRLLNDIVISMITTSYEKK
jgi:hypothetical protein